MSVPDTRFMPNADAPGTLHTGSVIDGFHTYPDAVRERDRVQALGFNVLLLFVPSTYQRRQSRPIWLLVVVDNPENVPSTEELKVREERN